MWKIEKVGIFSILIGISFWATADDPCWNFGFAHPGQLCFIINEEFASKVLVGRVIPSKDGQKNLCLHENQVKETSIQNGNFASLLGDYKGLQRVMPDTDPLPAPQFVNRFGYCHPNHQKAKEHPLDALLKLTASQDTICFNAVRGEGGPGVNFGIWDDKSSSCKSLNVTYVNDGVRQYAEMKKNSRIVEACHWVVLKKSGWAVGGPKRWKDNWRTTTHNPRQGMLDCMKKADEHRYNYQYCSYDLEGYYYIGIDVDWGDTEGQSNTVLERMCFQVVADK